mmetsp:Transcript_12432/g.27172  ORF Transcript_12432/g.27172 Transcript_12432/m.27172 type:complete len:444 (-) Transcript_12432:911-2242(-)
MEEPTDGASQQHLQQPTNTRRSKRRVAMTTSLVLIVLSGLFFFTELRGLKLSNYLKNESDAEKSPVVVVVQTEAVEKDIQEKRPKRNRKNEKKARGPAAAARADHNNADDDASTEPSDIRTHIMNQLPDIRAFTKSQPSPVCHPHMQLALPGFKWFNASKFTRLYFYHARKAGGTSLADYFVKVAHHHGLEFQVDEWTAAEEPSTSDKETFYVAHLREPVDRAISHFKYQGRWNCRDLIKMRRKDNPFVPTEDNAQKLESWSHTGGHNETTCNDGSFKMGNCAVNCYTQWFTGLSCPAFNITTEVQYEVAKSRLLRYNFVVILEKLHDPEYAAAVERYFGVKGVLQTRSAFCERVSHNANILNPLHIKNDTLARLKQLNEVDSRLYNEMSECLDSGDYNFGTIDPTRISPDPTIQVPYDQFDTWRKEQRIAKHENDTIETKTT